mgnify:CR=1 FL=1
MPSTAAEAAASDFGYFALGANLLRALVEEPGLRLQQRLRVHLGMGSREHCCAGRHEELFARERSRLSDATRRLRDAQLEHRPPVGHHFGAVLGVPALQQRHQRGGGRA